MTPEKPPTTIGESSNKSRRGEIGGNHGLSHGVSPRKASKNNIPKIESKTMEEILKEKKNATKVLHSLIYFTKNLQKVLHSSEKERG